MATTNLKLPPNNPEAEESVLGALMIDRDAIIRVADVLRAPDFYKPANAKIYEAILKLFEKHQPVDILSVSTRLKEDNVLADIGGSSYLTELVSAVPTASHVEHYAKIVKEKKILRDLINTSAEITEHAFREGEDIENVLDDVEQKIFAISQRSITQKFIPIKDELQAAFERIERLHRGEGALRGVPTGFAGLDNLLSGLQQSDLIVVGARPSLGKTSLVLDIARHVAIKEGKPVGLFSLEMSRDQVIDRLISAEAEVPLWRLRTGRVNEESDFELIQHALDLLSRAPIFIDDSASPNILQMRSMARRLQIDHNLGLIVVDYLQLIQPRTNSDNMVQQITEISRGLKGLSRELNVPVLAVSQLSRAVDQREVKVPRLSDLRESGCLTGDTLIARADTGELLTMKKLALRKRQEPIPIFTLDEHWQVTTGEMVKVFSSGRKKIFELRTQSGRVIKASANHPFRKLDEWIRLDGLKVGDAIALPRVITPTAPPNPLQSEELILLAHLLGDGCTLPNQPIHYTSGDFENILTVKETAEKLFSIEGRVVRQKNWWHVYLPSPHHLTHGVHHPITDWFRSIGIDLYHSWGKRVPACVFASSADQIALFLRHLWSTDGNISWKKLEKRSPGAAIYYASTSNQLARQVHHLLLRLGIQSRLSKVNQGKYRPIYQVHVQGSQNQLLFLTTIGANGERGRVAADLIAALQAITPNPNVDIIPREAWQIAVLPAKERVGVSWRDVSRGINTAYCGSTLFRAGISRARMARLASVCESSDLRNLATSGVFWDRVVSVTPAGEEEVYDATVPGTHNFVANDIIAHNSIEQDADVVLFIYRKDRDKMNVAPEEENMAEIIIAKHRNGPLGTVKLKFDADKATFRSIDTTHTGE